MYSLLQIAEAAEKTVPTVRQHIKAGHLKAAKIAGHAGYRVTKANAEAWMSRNCPTKLKNLPKLS